MNDGASLEVFFDSDHVVVARLVSSRLETPSAHMSGTYWTFERPIDDDELVAAIRAGWELDGHSDLTKDERAASWQPIRDIFGHERHDEVNSVAANRVIFSNPLLPDGPVTDKIAIAPTRWRHGNRENLPRSPGASHLAPADYTESVEVPPDASTTAMGAAAKQAMAMTLT